MKKLLTLLLLSPFAFADDEFPIELTCEIGANIIFLHFAENKDNSWWKNHTNNNSLLGGGLAGKGPFGDTKYKNKKNEFNKIILINDSRIEFVIGGRSISAIGINRLNGKADGGQCFKGFKEYKKQI